MKYIYKPIEIENINRYTNKPYTQLIGASFVSEDNKTNNLLLSNNFIIDKNSDKIAKSLQDMSCFFGGSGELRKDLQGYIGKWTDEINKNCNVYYLISDNEIYEIILLKYNNVNFSNLAAIQYIANINGKMMDIIPDINDCLFDNYEEAKIYLNELKKA